MASDPEVLARLTLLVAAGGDPRLVCPAVIEAKGGVAALESTSLRARLREGTRQPQTVKEAERQLAQAAEHGVRWWVPDGSRNVADAALLSLRGQLPGGPMVAIVGSREADPYGLLVAESLGRALAEAGVGVVSGAARGIDEAAMRGALAAGGRVVAVLGTGLLGERDPGKRAFLDAIADRGAVVSEYLLDAHGATWTFPPRNRIIAALGVATVVVQAAKRSGSLITAEHATKLGRPVFAVPGDVLYPLSSGTNALLGAGKARVFTHPRDLLDVLGLKVLSSAAWPSGSRGVPPMLAPRGTGSADLGAASGVLDALRSGALAFDALLSRVPLEVGALSEVLFDLELKGQVTRTGADCYVLTQAAA